MKNETIGWKIFNIFNITFMLGFCAIVLYPYLSVLAVALNDGDVAVVSGIMLWPKSFTLQNFSALLADANIKRASVISVIRVILGTLVALTVEFSCAYALSRKHMSGRKFLTVMFMIPMYISGGLIPTYLLYAQIDLINNPLVYIIPGAFNFFNFLLMRTYINTIPESLEESAKLDGANDLVVLWKIFIPLSTPILATIGLYQAVYHWNDWTTTLYFVSSSKWFTLQFELQRVLKEADRLAKLVQEAIKNGQLPPKSTLSSAGIKNAQIILTSLPIILIYPFLQKYFIKGMLIGGVKE